MLSRLPLSSRPVPFVWNSCSMSSFSFAILSADSALRDFSGSGLRERVCVWERSGRAGHAHWGRRTAHAGRWRAWRPESRGSPCSPPARVPAPGVVGQLRARPRAGLARRRLRAGQESSSCLAPGTRRVGGGARPEREKAGELAGCEARGGRLGSMSQQRPARKLPSLLVDPAEETVRRRCRDPINVEGLLVSVSQRRGRGAGWGVSQARGEAGLAVVSVVRSSRWPGTAPRSPQLSHCPSRPVKQTGLSLELSPSCLRLLANVLSASWAFPSAPE